jgi:iron complex transport system ATP-binding protein
MIDVSRVTKRYGQAAVVDNVSLTIPKGGITSIIGPNGAGKSTLLSLMSRLMKPDEGVIEVDGLDVAKTPGDTLARRLSILRQENHIASRLTVKDLVAFGRYPYSKGRLTEHDRTCIESALEYMKLGDLSHRFLDELSGGQRQRAFVAMVLCQDTDYLLLDEPLNHLDMKHAVAMMRQLRSTADELSKTIVLVLHDINFASAYSDHMVAMRDGKLCHAGPPEEIMQPAVLGDIYEIDVPVHTLNGNRIGVYFR